MGTKKAQNSELYFAPSEPPISAPPLCTLRVQKFSLAPRIIYLSPLLQNIKETIMFLAFVTLRYPLSTLQIYTAGIGTHVKSVKVTSICHRYYHVKV